MSSSQGNTFLTACRIKPEQYEKRDFIGGGAFGEVFTCYLKTTKTLVAMKILKPFKNSKASNPEGLFMQELENLANLHHPGTLRLIGFDLPNPVIGKNGKPLPCDGPIIFTPFLENGSLSKFIRSYQKNVEACNYPDSANIEDYPEIMLYHTILTICFYGIARALGYLHKNGKIHRDLKLDNVLLNTFFEPVLADFGLSIDFDPSEAQGYAGSPLYMAPEVFQGNCTPKSDIFSYGILLYQVWNPSILESDSEESINEIFKFEGETNTPSSFQDLETKRLNGKLPEKIDSIPKHIWNLIVQCLSTNPDDRPSAEELVQFFEDEDGWLEGVNPDDFSRYCDKVDYEENKVHSVKQKWHIYHPVERPICQ